MDRYASNAGSGIGGFNTIPQMVFTALENWTCPKCMMELYVNPSYHHICGASGVTFHITYQGQVISKEETNMDIAKRLRELKLSKADKLLYKYGLITESGQLTQEGRDAVLQAAYDLVKPGLVVDLEKLAAEDKKK